MQKIFDAHSHYMPALIAQNTSFFKEGWSDCSKQLLSMDKNGVEKALLLYPTSDAHLKMGWSGLCDEYNKSISNLALKYPDRFIPAAILPLGDHFSMKEYLTKVKDSGFKIISLPSSFEGKFLDDDLFVPIFEFARKNKINIHVHSQIIDPIGEERVKDPLLSPVLEYVFDVSMTIGKMMMSGTFLNFPEIKFIFAHYGGVLPFVNERFDSTYSMLRKRNIVKDLGKTPKEFFSNIYIDTSGSKSIASLLCALEITDASHILFGSDYPANQNIPESIAAVQNAPISDEQKCQILCNYLLY